MGRKPLGGQTVYEYGSVSKLTAMQLSTGDRYRWKYDNEGNVIARTTAKGQEYTYSYGAFNVLTGIQRPSGRQLELRWTAMAG